MKTLKFEELTKEAIQNIRDDRREAKDLLKDLTAYIAGGSDRHKEVGFALAKYLETLQRSNEQLVKISSLLKKKTDSDTEITDEERNSIFEELNAVAKQSTATAIKKSKKNG